MDAPGIANHFKTSPVYVATDLPPTTASNISSLLTSTDGIKVAMLDAGQGSGTITQQVLASQPQGTTVIIASGDEVSAASSRLPAGDLSDLLSRAQNVSTNGLDTVRTLVANVHAWQAAHPQTEASAVHSVSSPLTVLEAVGPIASIPLVVAIVAVIVRQRRSATSSRVSGRTGPPELRVLIRTLMRERLQIHSESMRNAIEDLCAYTEEYFRQTGSDYVAQRTLQRQLTDAVKVTRTFKRIEAEPQYFRDARKVALIGRESIEQLRDSVLESVRNSNADALQALEVAANQRDYEAERRSPEMVEWQKTFNAIEKGK